MDLTLIASNMKRLRVAKNLSELELSHMALTAERNVEKVEEAIKVPTHVIWKLIEALDTTMEEISTPRKARITKQ